MDEQKTNNETIVVIDESGIANTGPPPKTKTIEVIDESNIVDISPAPTTGKIDVIDESNIMDHGPLPTIKLRESGYRLDRKSDKSPVKSIYLSIGLISLVVLAILIIWISQ